MPKDIVIIPASGQIVFSGSSTHHNVLTVDSSSITIATDNFIIDGGNITATSFNVTHFTSSFITASTIVTEGSNIFGDTIADTHTFNGHITASGQISSSGTGTNYFGGNIQLANTKKLIVDNGDFIQWSDNANFAIGGMKLADDYGFLTFNAGNTTNYVIQAWNSASYEAVGIGGTGGSIPPKTLTVFGDISASGDLHIQGNITASAGNFSSHITASGNISSSGNLHATDLYVGGEQFTDVTIHPNHWGIGVVGTGNLGLTNLTASGNISASGQLIAASADFNDGAITNVSYIDTDSVRADAATNVRMALGTSGFTFNAEAGDLFDFNSSAENTDFRVRGEGEDNVIYVDASADKLGIGTTTPSKLLTVAGDISASGIIYNNIASAVAGEPLIQSKYSNSVKFEVTNTGKVGIGKENPTKQLEVAGDISASGIFHSGVVGSQVVIGDGNITASGHISMSGGTGTNYLEGHLVVGNATQGHLYLYGGAQTGKIYRHDERRIEMLSDGANNFYGTNGYYGFRSTDTSVVSGQNYISFMFNNADSIVDNAAIFIQATENHAEEANGGSKFLFNAFANAEDPTNTLSDAAYNVVTIDPNGAAGHLEVKGNISASGDFYLKDTKRVINDGRLWISASSDLHLVGGGDFDIKSGSTTQMVIHGNTGNVHIGDGASVLNDIDKKLVVGGDISASGYLSTESHITASGNISASGNVYSDGYLSDNKEIAYGYSDTAYLGYHNGWEDISIGKNPTQPVKFVGNITSSGNISSSGTIYGLNADFNGDLDVDGTTNLDVVDIDGAANLASTLTMAAGQFQYYDADGTCAWRAYDSPGGRIMMNRIGGVGGLMSMSGSGGHAYVGINVGIGGAHPNIGLTVKGMVSASSQISTNSHIIASGNISSSGGTITGDIINASGRFGFASDTLRMNMSSTANNLNIYGTDAGLETTGHISASGNISASGDINSRFQLSFDYNGRTSATGRFYTKSDRGGFASYSTDLGGNPSGSAVSYLASARYSSYTAPRACKLVRMQHTMLNYTNDDDIYLGVYKGTAVNDSAANITLTQIGTDIGSAMDEDETFMFQTDFSSDNTLAAGDFILFCISTPAYTARAYPRFNITLELQYT